MAFSALPYRLPLRGYAWARGTQHVRTGVLVRLELDGHVGWGEVAPPPDHHAEDLVARTQHMMGRVDPHGPRFLSALDNVSDDPRVRAGLACAWIDVQARKADQAMDAWLADHMGVSCPGASSVPANGLIDAVGPEEAAEQARAMAEHDVLKVKCTADREGDLARVAAIHGERPDALLRLDANASWDPDHVVDHVRALQEACDDRIEYLEQPIAPDDLDTARVLRDETGARIAWDEPVTGPTALQRLVDVADAVILKPARLGGPDHAAMTARLAGLYGLQTVVTNSLETAVGRAAAWHVAALLEPTPCGLATDRFLAEDVASLPTLHGAVARPAGPGLGLEVSRVG